LAPVPAPRRLGPIAIVALAALGIGALLAITQGWLRPSPPEPRVDVAKAKLEADLAAADKARVDAEQRAKAADAETARLRAESEASALKAKAATDAAAIRAKAETDAAALRAKAAGDASRAKAPAPPAVAAAAPIPATPSLAPTSYDGLWSVRQQCAALPGSPAFNREATIAVLGGEFYLQRGKEGAPGYGFLRGTPQADGKLVMTGSGISPVPSNYGQPFDSRFEGAWTGDAFRLKGRLGSRPCLLELTRASASASPSK